MDEGYASAAVIAPEITAAIRARCGNRGSVAERVGAKGVRRYWLECEGVAVVVGHIP